MPDPDVDPRQRIGGSAMRPDPARFDPAYPEMEAWAGAGVTGGLGHQRPLRAEVPAGADVAAIQAALDAAAAAGGGEVRLAKGTYLIDRTLHLRAGVVLSGGFFDFVKLHVVMRGTWNRLWTPEPDPVCAIRAEGIAGAGLEQLTITFDESLPPPRTVRRLEPGFDNDPHGRDDLFVTMVRFDRCRDCWIEGCRIIDAGSTPLAIVRSRHCTARDCEIVGAHNRNGGQAYLNVSRSESCLLTGLVVKDIRHLSIQNEEPDFPCRHNVVIACDLEVDVNFHNGDSGRNLIEDCRIVIPSWHWWSPIALGAPSMHRPPGPRNLVFRCDARRLRQGGRPRATVAADPGRVYEVASAFGQPAVSDIGAAPAGGTLYSVQPLGM